MTNVDNLKPDTRAELNQLFEKIEALNVQVAALELPSQIEFCRLFRIAESSVELIMKSETDFIEARDQLRQKNKAVDKAGFWVFGIGSLYFVVNNFYTLSFAGSIPFWLFMAAWYGNIAFDAWNCEKKMDSIKEMQRHYRFSFHSAGFSGGLLYEITQIEKKESTEAFSDAYMLNDQQIELAIKTACFQLCRGVRGYGYRHTPPFKN